MFHPFDSNHPVMTTPAVWHPGVPRAQWAVVQFRKVIDLDAPAAAESLWVAGSQRVELWLDGGLIARGPSRSDEQRWGVMRVAVPALAAGRHVLAARVWHAGDHTAEPQLGPPRSSWSARTARRWRGGRPLRAGGVGTTRATARSRPTRGATAGLTTWWAPANRSTAAHSPRRGTARTNRVTAGPMPPPSPASPPTPGATSRCGAGSARTRCRRCGTRPPRGTVSPGPTAPSPTPRPPGSAAGPTR